MGQFLRFHVQSPELPDMRCAGTTAPKAATKSFTLTFPRVAWALIRVAAAREGLSVRRWLGVAVGRAAALPAELITTSKE